MSIGLVLSGGGIRGVAHIGVLKALKEKKIKITHLAGTSAGAIIGALYAAGHSWEEILVFFLKVPISHYKRYAHNKPGFIDTSRGLIKPILASAAFPGLFTPVIIDKIPYVDGDVLNNFPPRTS